MRKFVVETLNTGEQVESGEMEQHDAEIIAKVRSRGSVSRQPSIVMVGDGMGAVLAIYFNGLKYHYDPSQLERNLMPLG